LLIGQSANHETFGSRVDSGGINDVAQAEVVKCERKAAP